MTKILKENWFKFIVALCLILVTLAFMYSVYRQYNKSSKTYLNNEVNLSTTTSNIQSTDLNNDLCKTTNLTPPLAQEIAYDKEIKRDEFVNYLRRSLDDFSSSKYLPCTSSCGLLDGVHYADSAYDDLKNIPTIYLRSKFIVLATDIAPGGGESIVLMFKDLPDQIFYAWVYGHGDEYFDLRAFSVYNSTEEESTSLEDAQKIYINQLCNQELGL